MILKDNDTLQSELVQESCIYDPKTFVLIALILIKLPLPVEFPFSETIHPQSIQIINLVDVPLDVSP